MFDVRISKSKEYIVSDFCKINCPNPKPSTNNSTSKLWGSEKSPKNWTYVIYWSMNLWSTGIYLGQNDRWNAPCWVQTDCKVRIFYRRQKALLCQTGLKGVACRGSYRLRQQCNHLVKGKQAVIITIYADRLTSVYNFHFAFILHICKQRSDTSKSMTQLSLQYSKLNKCHK